MNHSGMYAHSNRQGRVSFYYTMMHHATVALPAPLAKPLLGTQNHKGAVVSLVLVVAVQCFKCCCPGLYPCAAAAAWLSPGPPVPCPISPWPAPPVGKRREYVGLVQLVWHTGRLGMK